MALREVVRRKYMDDPEQYEFIHNDSLPPTASGEKLDAALKPLMASTGNTAGPIKKATAKPQNAVQSL